MNSAEIPRNLPTTRLERRYANISPLTLILKYQQRVMTALSSLYGFFVLLSLIIVSVLFAIRFFQGNAPGLGSAFLTLSPVVLSWLFISLLVAGIACFFVPGYARWPLILMASNLYGWIGLLWLGIERLVNRLGKVGGIIGIVLGVLLLTWSLIALDVGFGSMMRAADAVGNRHPVIEICIALLGLPIALLPWYAAFVLLRAAITTLRLSPLERSLLRDAPPGLAGDLLTRMWGMPATVPFARRPRRRLIAIIGLTAISTFFFALVSVLLIDSPLFLHQFETIAQGCNEASDREQCLQNAIPIFLFGSSIALSILVSLLIGVGSLCQRAVRRLLRFSLRELQTVDPRPPVLFLRAFGDDQISLRAAKAPWITQLLEFGRRRINLDQMLLEEATPYGPVVALGKPNDPYPPYGAARGYFENLSWQDAVADLASRGCAIVMCVDDTDGIWWEVEHLVSSEHIAKTLFFVHPKHAAPEANIAILGKLISHLRLDNPDARQQLLSPPPVKKKRNVDPETIVGFCVDQTGAHQITRSATHADSAYLLTIRLFLRERLALAPVLLPKS